MDKTGTNANHAGTSKWFRIATEGATTDGRNISRDWIEQMAGNYSPTLYGARVNLEHFRGITPDGPFKALGDVIALEAREETGEFKGKLGLYAQISPTPDLISITKARQKIYTSCEVDTSFADTKQAYLVGLAVTDSPASLGTSILSFAHSQGAQNPLGARKQSPQNVFSEAVEATIEFVPASEDNKPLPSVFTKVAEILGVVKKKGQDDDTRFSDMTQAVEVLASHGRELNEHFIQFAAKLAELHAGLDAEKQAREAAEKAFTDLKTSLSNESSSAIRPLVTGGGAVVTDC